MPDNRKALHIADETPLLISYRVTADAKTGRPLLLEGDPGVGKTDLARKLAQALHMNYFRLQCYAGLDASQAFARLVRRAFEIDLAAV